MMTKATARKALASYARSYPGYTAGDFVQELWDTSVAGSEPRQALYALGYRQGDWRTADTEISDADWTRIERMIPA